MKPTTFALALLAVVLSSQPARARSLPLERHDVVAKEFVLPPAAPRTVVIDNVFGSVTVRTGTGDRVAVEIRREVRARTEEELRAGLDEVSFASRADGGRLELGQDGPFRCGNWGSEHRRRGSCDWDPDYEVRWEWQVTLPADVDLEVRTVNDGDLRVSGVRGRVEAKNVNGKVHLAGLAGEVEAATVNGDLEAEFERAPGAASSFRTVNGEIELTLPAATGAELGFETMNGEIYTDFEAAAVPQKVRSTRDERHGSRYQLDRDTVVRIGAGGPRLDLQTLNGDIVVRAR